MIEKPLLPPEWQVPGEFRQRLGSSAGRQRLIEADAQLLLILHTVPKPSEQSRVGRLFWRDGLKAWHSSDMGEGPAALNSHLEEFSMALDRFEELEARAVAAEEHMTMLEGLAPLVRTARNLLQVFEEARRAAPEDRELLNCRDQAYELSRRADLLAIDAKNAMDVAVIRRAEQQAAASERMSVAAHRLNMLAAFFFPIVTLSTILGTGLIDSSEPSRSYLPFMGLVAVSLLMGSILARFVARDSNK